MGTLDALNAGHRRGSIQLASVGVGGGPDLDDEAGAEDPELHDVLEGSAAGAGLSKCGGCG